MKTLTTLLLLWTAAVWAQPIERGTVKGNVLSEAGKPQEFATLMLLKTTDSSLVKGAIADADGRYTFENVGAGNYLVAAQQLGFRKTYSPPFSISPEQPAYTVPDLRMTEETKTLEGVAVVAKKPFIEQQVDRTVVNVENSIVGSGSTALEVLEKAPGVTIDRQNDQIQLKGKAGVIVYIDGKQTYLSQQEVSNLLKNTPSDNIASIEIITNPGSKYDAAGNSGIINIKMKKNKNFGTNGSVIVTAGDGWARNMDGVMLHRPKYGTTLNLNNRTAKLNLFGNLNYANRQMFNSNIIDRVIQSGGTTTNFLQRSFRPSQFITQSFKAGLDYYISSKSTVGVVVNGFNNDWHNNGLARTSLRGVGTGTVLLPTTETYSQELLKNLTTNLNYKYDFDGKGHEWTADVDFVRYDGQGQNKLSTSYRNAAGEITQPNQDMRNLMPSRIDIWAFKTDYVHPLKNGAKVETGLKTSFVNADNTTRYDTLQQESRQWLYDASRSNQFLYNERIMAAYVNFAGKLSKNLKYQTGLRAEHTHSVGNSVTLNRRVERNYLNLFPTVFLSQTLDSNNVLNLSYSRRIDRPDYGSLNPFVGYLDPYTYQQGNPFLRPQYTNSVELTHVYKSKLSTTLGVSRASDYINYETPYQVAEKNITYITPENLGNLDNINLTISYPLTIAKWWTAQTNLNAYYMHYKTFYDNVPFDMKRTAYNLYVSNNFTLNKTTTAELSAWYNSASLYGFYQARPMGAFSVGVQKKLMDGKANLKLNINDPFWLNHFSGRAIVGPINFGVQSRWESRRVMLTFTYRFGNQNIKAAREHKSATSSEQGRVKGSN